MLSRFYGTLQLAILLSATIIRSAISMCVQHVTVTFKGMLVSEYKSALKHIPIMVSADFILVLELS